MGIRVFSFDINYHEWATNYHQLFLWRSTILIHENSWSIHGHSCFFWHELPWMVHELTINYFCDEVLYLIHENSWGIRGHSCFFFRHELPWMVHEFAIIYFCDEVVYLIHENSWGIREEFVGIRVISLTWITMNGPRIGHQLFLWRSTIFNSWKFVRNWWAFVFF